MTSSAYPERVNPSMLISVLVPSFHFLVGKFPRTNCSPSLRFAKVLGVQLDLRQSGDSLCLVSNTTERVEELVQDIDNILSAGTLPKAEGERLRGRLQFASSQVFGRKLKRLLKVLSNHVAMGRKSMSDLTKECLIQVSTILTRSSPRRVVASQSDILHIYVDAAFNEVDYSGIGGLIIDMHGDCLSFFSAKVEKEMIDAIVSRGQRTIIQELEMLAVLCAFKCWQERATVHRIMLFTDSESVRGAFLKSWSANTDSDRLLNSIFEIESLFSLPVWIERVPSQSNPADILSREIVTKLGSATKVEVDPWEMWNTSAE